jgi:glycosyltransferase involved in cell wall biosynthesis
MLLRQVRMVSRKLGDEFDWYGSPSPIEKPAVSVILSTYNRSRQEGGCESLLQRAITSILNQKFTNFELILIDDNSDDGTEDYGQEIAREDPRVQFFRFKKNSGIPAKRYNFGMSVSRGKYISFMFDDDQWELHALEDLYQAIENEYRTCGMVYGLVKLYRGSDRENMAILGGRWGASKINSHNFIGNNAVIVKRSAIDLVGGYDEDPTFLRTCDWDLWWRIGRKFKIGRIKSQVAIVYSDLPASIGLTKKLDLAACRKRQKSHRLLPLQINQKEPLRCKIRSALFEIYVFIFRRYAVKKMLKKALPPSIYQYLKKKGI